MVIDGYEIMPVKVDIAERTGNGTVLRMELYEGRNRQIRKMCEQVGLRIRRLTRVAIGELTLGGLPSGKWRRLTEKEIDYLKGAK